MPERVKINAETRFFAGFRFIFAGFGGIVYREPVREGHPALRERAPIDFTVMEKEIMAASFSWLCRAAAAGAMLFAAGCGEHPAPPLERTDLVLRFFRSIRNGDFHSAARQGDKIHQLDNYNSSVMKLIAIQEGNSYIRRAQEALNRGDVTAARLALEEGARQFPGNRNLVMLGGKVRQLRNAEKLLRNMEKAKSSSAMSAALTAASVGLSANLTPKLQEYFRFYEKKIARAEAKEREERRRQLREIPAVPEPAVAPEAVAPPESAAAKKNPETPAPTGNGNAAAKPPVEEPVK